MKKIILLFVLAFGFSASYGQGLNITIIDPGQDTTICEGDTVNLECTSAFLFNDFNNGTIGIGWSSTQANPVFTNPCGPGPVGTHLWVGTTPSPSRTLVTNTYDLTAGGACYIEFWMRYGLVPGAGPCEDPDASTEGVHLQYSTNNGLTWTDFPGPDLAPVGNLSTTGPFTTQVPGTGGYWAPFSSLAQQQQSTLYHWNLYNCPIPAAAVSTTTSFRWAQLTTSSTGFDAWGIDEVIIGCTPPNLLWSTGNTTTTDTVAPTDTTVYWVQATDVNGVQVWDTVTVNVLPRPLLGPDITVPCGDSTFIITVNKPIDCNSISPDGSDFRMSFPNGDPLPIIAAQGVNCQNGVTQQILLTGLFDLTPNGTFTVWSKVGNDFNSLTSECGSLGEFDTVLVNIFNCYEVDVDLKNVTVVNDDHPMVEWGISTDTLWTDLAGLFTEYQIFRSLNPGGPYGPVGSETNFYATSWEDLSLNQVDVNSNAYNYFVRMVYDAGLSATSDSIATILLDCGNNPVDTLQLDVQWSDYWGWDNPTYYVQYQGGNGVWVNADTTTDATSTFLKPYDADNYVVRVISEFTDTGSVVYRTESNYCEFIVYQREPRLKMPNVFTPGGTFPYYNAVTANDSTTNLVEFNGQIFNRWGKQIYEWTDWETPSAGWSGEGHPEGTYYYVVRAVGEEGEELEVKGHLTLIRNE